MHVDARRKLPLPRHRRPSPTPLRPVPLCPMPPPRRHGEAAMEQQQHLSAAAMQALFQGLSPAAVAFLHIQVRRSHVVKDALNQVRRAWGWVGGR